MGTNYGVGLDEQLAVLGQLSRTLGTEASSAYEGFMTGAIEGAKSWVCPSLTLPENVVHARNAGEASGQIWQEPEGNLKSTGGAG